LGGLLLGLGQLDAAEPLLISSATQSNFSDYRSVANLALLQNRKGQPGLALRTLMKGYEAASKEDDRAVATLSNGIAEVYQSTTKYSLAADWYLQAALRNPKDEDLWLKASSLQFPEDGQDLKLAENVLLQGLQSLPQSTLLLHSLGRSQLLIGRIDAAITLYEQALRLSPEDFNVIAGLATALHQSSQPRNALRFYQLALNKQPDNVVLLANSARLVALLGEQKQAAELLRRAHSLQPQNEDVRKVATDLGLTF
jgi:tetratricopeptide (TPR) repeat protein